MNTPSPPPKKSWATVGRPVKMELVKCCNCGETAEMETLWEHITDEKNGKFLDRFHDGRTSGSRIRTDGLNT
jgi:hypothetical protein